MLEKAAEVEEDDWRRRRSTRKRGGRTECSDYHENPVESVAPRGRKTGPADKNHSRCVTYRFECDGRRSPPILLSLHLPLPPHYRTPSPAPLPAPFHHPACLDLSAFLSFLSLSRVESLSRAQYTNSIVGDLIHANFERTVKYPPSRERGSILATRRLALSQKRYLLCFRDVTFTNVRGILKILSLFLQISTVFFDFTYDYRTFDLTQREIS